MISIRSSIIILALASLSVAENTKMKSNLRKNSKDTKYMFGNAVDGQPPRVTIKKHFDSMHRGATIKATPVLENFIGAQSTGQCNMLKRRKARKEDNLGPKIFLKIGQLVFGERFEGQTQIQPKGIVGMSDGLTGTPVGPLKLTANYNDRENLYVETFCPEDGTKCGIQIKGRGPTGVKGPGAISIMFTRIKKTVQISFRSSGASRAETWFFDKWGNILGKLEVDIEANTDYKFTDDSESRGRIAGMSIVPKGDALTWHKFSLVGICVNEGSWF